MSPSCQIEKEYGWGSEELKSAERLLDQALEQVLPALARAFEGRLVSQLVLQSQVIFAHFYFVGQVKDLYSIRQPTISWNF